MKSFLNYIKSIFSKPNCQHENLSVLESYCYCKDCNKIWNHCDTDNKMDLEEWKKLIGK